MMATTLLEGIAGEADNPAADIAAQGEDSLTEGLEALVDPALSGLPGHSAHTSPECPAHWPGPHPTAPSRLPRIWAVCSITGCASRRSRNAASNNEPRKTIHRGDRATNREPDSAVREGAWSTRRTSGSSM